MKKMYFLTLIISIMFALSGCSESQNTKGKTTEEFAIELQKVNAEGINMKLNEINMKDDKNGVAEITVRIPDYKKLYEIAYKSSDPDKFLLDMLETGKYERVERIMSANVVVENGEQIIYKEEALKELLEQETIAVINEMMEVE